MRIKYIFLFLHRAKQKTKAVTSGGNILAKNMGSVIINNNTVAKRLKRTLLENKRTVLFYFRYTYKFWAEFFVIAAPLRKITMICSIDSETQEQRLFGKLTDVRNLTTFGIEVWMHEGGEYGKLHTKSSIEIFF